MTTDYVREYVGCTYQCAEDLLLELSDRYVAMAKELGLPHVPLLFAFKHGRISSGHYRTLAHVFECLICDLPEAQPVKDAVHDVLTWYWATRASRFSATSIATLRDLGSRMHDSLEFFQSDEMRARYRADAAVHASILENVPKMHRAVSHIPDYVIEFGPYEDLTTEASETANKPLKQMFRA